MINVPLSAVPGQTFTIRLDGSRYDFEVKEGTNCMAVTVARDGVTLVDGHRAVAGALLLPYDYMEQGNFLFLTEQDELPAWQAFGVTQSLVYLNPAELAIAVAGGTPQQAVETFRIHPVFFPTYVLDFSATMPVGFTFTRASIATYTNAAGLLVTAANNVPRIDYSTDGSHTPLGLLIERPRVNSVLYSTDFTQAYWVKNTPAAVTPAAKVAPDGTNTGTLITGMATASHSVYSFTSGGLANVQTEPSVWMAQAPGSVDGTIVLLNSRDIQLGWWRIDLAKLSTSFQRITRHHPAVTVLANFFNNASGQGGIYIAGGGGAIAKSVYVWGAQWEEGVLAAAPEVTSYIPTAGVAVTRAADRAFITGMAPVPATPTVIVECSGQPRTATVLSFNDGATNAIEVALSPAGPTWRAFKTGAGGTILNPQVPPVPGANVMRKIAATWGPYSAAIGWGGGPVEQLMYPILPTVTLTRLDVGATAAGANIFIGHIKKISIAPYQYPTSVFPVLTA